MQEKARKRGSQILEPGSKKQDRYLDTMFRTENTLMGKCHGCRRSRLDALALSQDLPLLGPVELRALCSRKPVSLQCRRQATFELLLLEESLDDFNRGPAA